MIGVVSEMERRTNKTVKNDEMRIEQRVAYSIH